MEPENPASTTESTPAQTKTVTAASIVAGDNDNFPPAGNTNPPPLPGATAPNSQTPPPEGKRGRGRPPGSKNKRPGDPSFSDLPPPQPEKPVDYKAMSLMIFKITTGTMAQVFGPEWLPRQPPPGMPGEEEMIVEAGAEYMKTKNMPDIPPGVLLLLLCAGYAAPRFHAPSTKEKVKGIWFWIRSKFTRKKKTHVSSETPRQPEKPQDEKKAPDAKVEIVEEV